MVKNTSAKKNLKPKNKKGFKQNSFLSTSLNQGAKAIGRLSHNNSNINENGKEAMGLDKHNNFAHASRFFVHFFAVVERLCHEIA